LSRIEVHNGGILKVDGVNIYGWNFTANREISDADETYSPYIGSYGNNDMDITNSNFRRVHISFEDDMSAGDLVDNNSLYFSSPDGINLISGGNERVSNGQTISNNYIYTNGGYTIWGTNWTRDLVARDSVFKNNKFFMRDPALSDAMDNTEIPNNSTIIGNEWVFSMYNMVDFPIGTFSKYNNLHDNGGNHNGFNMMTFDGYSNYDYCHDFTGYDCFYTQVGDGHGLPYEYADHLYIFNSASKDAGGIKFAGFYDGYVYNHTADNSSTHVLLGGDRIFFRKSFFTGGSSEEDGSPIFLDDLMNVKYADGSGGYDYLRNVYVIDSEFTQVSSRDYIIYSQAGQSPQGNPTVWSINTVRKTGGTVQRPVTYVQEQNGETRSYVYLDALVQDSSGSPVSGATVTVEALNHTDFPAKSLSLPPPPPELNSHPGNRMPMPSVAAFTSTTTGANGHTPLPNYGWSQNVEATPILAYYFESDNADYPAFSSVSPPLTAASRSPRT
jgi:hypothetical protein